MQSCSWSASLEVEIFRESGGFILGKSEMMLLSNVFSETLWKNGKDWKHDFLLKLSNSVLCVVVSELNFMFCLRFFLFSCFLDQRAHVSVFWCFCVFTCFVRSWQMVHLHWATFCFCWRFLLVRESFPLGTICSLVELLKL